MTETDIPTPYLIGATFHTTNKCNFTCAHCLRGEPGREEISRDDFLLAMGKINSSALNIIQLTGGETRLLSWFPQFGDTLRGVIRENGGQLFTDREPEDKREEIENLESVIKSTINQLPDQLRKKWDKSGQLKIFKFRQILERGYQFNRQLTVELDTNCFGMNTPAQTIKILNSLYSQGVNIVRLSLDLAHREDVIAHPELSPDYTFISELCTNDFIEGGDPWLQSRLPKDMKFISLGNGAYALPLGRAANLSLEERVRLAGVPVNKVPSKAQQVRQKLSQEYRSWGKILDGAWAVKHNDYGKFSHCYCGPAIFYRVAERVMSFSSENRIDRFVIVISPDLSVSLCSRNFLLSLGNLRESSPAQLYNRFAKTPHSECGDEGEVRLQSSAAESGEADVNLEKKTAAFQAAEVYRKAVGAKLYEILGHEGPQGLARRLTDWPDKEIEQKFIERTPCGLCQDLARSYPAGIKDLMDERSNFGEPRTEAKSKFSFLHPLKGKLG